jgi:TolB-like protein/class 3 adenylate cyclase/lipopolysaccharide biosynthesis regulator YciM
MSAETKKEIQLEIAHVLFIDIVGYSKLSINEQRAAVDELNEAVRASEQFQKGEASDRLIKIPTGDGMALVFYTSPEAPAQCAIEISRALKDHPRLQLRMGVHSGPVSGVIDVTGRANLAGAGLNTAQRVMECGDAGHILLSKHVAEDLEEYEQWRPLLHDLGACEMKHGVRVSVVNLHGDGVGNPQLPKKFQALKKRSARVRWAAMTPVLLALALIVAGIAMFSRYRGRATLAAPEKSIAVLPFENLSRDPDNAYFATGIQDEILTRLAKIGALKVIARTSTQQYAARPGNLSEIARQLAVANILEGAVQKAGDQVHINVQLIRAATDEHLWAESYDRKLENIFAVEAEVASSVAEALKAKLTGAEQDALAEKPTTNLEAYDAYLRGLAYALRTGYSENDTLDAIKYFSEAVELDPKFALAWTWLAHESALGYFNSLGTDVPGLRETAKRAAEKVAELEPNRGEAYLAKGYYQYYCDRDYDPAIASFDKARQLSPGNSDILQALGLIWRRKSEWQLSLKYFQEAIELDPRNISLLSLQADAYFELRQYSAALKGYDRILEISPDNPAALASKAGIYQSKGDLPAAATLLSRIHPDPSSDLFGWQILQWIYERRYTEAIEALEKAIARHDRPLSDWQRIRFLSTLALLQQFSGDTAHARETWQQVKADAEKLRATKGEKFGLEALVEAYAALGDKTKALATLEHTPVLPASDPFRAAFFAEIKARIAVQAGDNDLAFEQLAITAQNSVGISYGDLKLNPLWDPLRGDPRFEKIVASLAPKDAK